MKTNYYWKKFAVGAMALSAWCGNGVLLATEEPQVSAEADAIVEKTNPPGEKHIVIEKEIVHGDDQDVLINADRKVVVGLPHGPGPGPQALPHDRLMIRAIEPGASGGVFHRPESTWLGLGTDEAPEVLSSQMGLEPGVGLIVTRVVTNSPAAQAGLQKNDVIVSFEGQSLVLPNQLRKLVQARKEGDEVKIGYYRAGKKQTTKAVLGKGREDDFFGRSWEMDLRDLHQQLRDAPFRETFRESMRGAGEALGALKFDHERVKEEVRRSLEEAKRALEKALREAGNARGALAPAEQALREVEKARARADQNASVVVRKSMNNARSIVKSDEDGTLVIVGNPDLRLTAHDKDGKLIFDGQIQTPQEREKVPRELWERVEPVLNQLEHDMNRDRVDAPDKN